MDNPMFRFERILKDLDKCQRVARAAISKESSLESKLARCGIANRLQEARRKLLLDYHAYEDVMKIMLASKKMCSE